MGKLQLWHRFLCAWVVTLVSALHVGSALQDQPKSKVDLQKIADEMQGNDPFNHNLPQDEMDDQSEDSNQATGTVNSTGSVHIPSLAPISSSQSSWKYKSSTPTKFAATPRPSQLMPKQKMLWDLMQLRHDAMRKVAYYGGSPSLPCPSKYVGVNDLKGYGRSGNHWITFAHLLWYATRSGATAVLPAYMVPIMEHFELGVLHKVACFITVHPDKVDVRHKSVDYFDLERLLDIAVSRNIPLPPDRDQLSIEIELFVSRVYLSIWSRPKESFFLYAFGVVSRYLGDSLQYTAVHKRGFEHGCSAHFITPDGQSLLSNYTDDELQLPLHAYMMSMMSDQPEGIKLHHPLCDMNDSFVRLTMQMHNRINQTIYVAYDGQEDCDIDGVFLDDVEEDLPDDVDPLYVDALLAIHSDLFILNPKSTFSWMIYVVRVALALQSVPRVPWHGYLDAPSSFMPFEDVISVAHANVQ